MLIFINTSAIAIATKLAAMSPSCYSLAEKIMDIYEGGGELEKKKKTEKNNHYHPRILFQFSLQSGPIEEQRQNASCAPEFGGK